MEQLRRLVTLMSLEAPGRWVLVLFLAVLTSGLEAMSALLIYLLLGVVAGAEDALTVPVLGDLSRFVTDVGEQDLVLVAGGLVAAFFVLRALVVLTRLYVESRVIENTGARLAQRLFGGYLGMPYAFHLRRNSAELLRNVNNTVQQLTTDVFRPVVKLLSEGLILLAFVGVLVMVAPAATAVVLLVLGPLVAVLLRVVYPRLRSLGEDSQRLHRTTIRSVQQGLEGIRDIILLGRRHFFEREFGQDRHRLARVRALGVVLSESPTAALETLMVLVMVAVLSLSVLAEGTAAGAIPLLGLFAYAALRLRPTLDQIIRGVTLLRFAGQALDDAYDDLREVDEIAPAHPERAITPLPFEESIVLDGVTFRYENSPVDVLRDVDLRIAKGESIGLIGPTGGGKSTLVDIIVGLVEPTQGAVLVDGIDVGPHVERWQRCLGMVHQHLFLTDDTIRRNVALGEPDDAIDDDRVHEAVRLAQFDDVIAELPDGLDTVVGERGVRLSGGQRQRVAIARALYHRPQVLIFDEGTSALDNRTEAALLKALDELRASHTLVTVAHRLTTVRACDRVYHVDRGVVRPMEQHPTLIARSALDPGQSPEA